MPCLILRTHFAVCLFVCLPWQEPLLIGQSLSFFFNLDSVANPQPEGLFALEVCPACVGFSCSLVHFSLEGEGAQDAHAGSVPGTQFIELTSRNGSGRDIGWLETKVCHRPCRRGMAEGLVGMHAAFIDLGRAYAGGKHRCPVSLSLRTAIVSGHYHMGGALPTNKVSPSLVHASCVSSLLV